MQIRPIVDTPGLTIGADLDNHWLYADWRGVYDQDSSQAACLLMLEVMRSHPYPKILNDNSNIIRTSVQLREWSVWWLEEMRRAGLHYIAWVFPPDFAARQPTEITLQVIERPVVGGFDDVASAYGWLQQQHIRQPR